MNTIFLVFGYGIPKDILKDEHYNIYLKLVFNQIYTITTEKHIEAPLIICSGGKTDMYKPYKRTEGGEMVRLLTHLAKRPFLKQITKNWRFIAEKTSLSTLENFLHCKEIAKKNGLNKANVYIFCEHTRKKRITRLAKETLGTEYAYTILPIDFDISNNRYLAPDFLREKERQVLQHDLWALQSPKNMKTYHKLFEEKFAFLRKAGPHGQVEAVRQWWEKNMRELGIY